MLVLVSLKIRFVSDEAISNPFHYPSVPSSFFSARSMHLVIIGGQYNVLSSKPVIVVSMRFTRMGSQVQSCTAWDI